ncbi:unnamed protein product [Rhizopus stolonifer]
MLDFSTFRTKNEGFDLAGLNRQQLALLRALGDDRNTEEKSFYLDAAMSLIGLPYWKHKSTSFALFYISEIEEVQLSVDMPQILEHSKLQISCKNIQTINENFTASFTCVNHIKRP